MLCLVGCLCFIFHLSQVIHLWLPEMTQVTKKQDDTRWVPPKIELLNVTLDFELWWCFEMLQGWLCRFLLSWWGCRSWSRGVVHYLSSPSTETKPKGANRAHSNEGKFVTQASEPSFILSRDWPWTKKIKNFNSHQFPMLQASWLRLL